MAAFKEFPEHVMICARALYEETDVPISAIAEFLGIASSTLSARAARLSWTPRNGARARWNCIAAAAGPDAAGLATRIRARVDREILQAEHNLDRTEFRSVAQSERAARTLASLTKTLNELKRLETGEAERGPKAEDEAIDIDEFRRDLARRLEALCAERTDPESC